MQITEEEIQGIVKKALGAYDREQKTRRDKKAFHNTRLLMNSYNDIKNSVYGSISDTEELIERDSCNGLEDIEWCEADRVFISSIKKSKLRSTIMLLHIDNALSYVKQKHKKEGDKEKFDIMYANYIKKMSYEELGEKYNCSAISARRWSNEVINELSIQLFGVDGIKTR